MATYSIPYGKQSLAFTIPDDRAVDIIAAPEVAPAADPQAVVQQALQDPLGGVRLEDFAGASHVAIAINDKTRPVPHQILLPPLLERLEQMGLPPERITLIIATGTHPPMPPEEYGLVLPPEILQRYPVICHNAKDESQLARLGTTSRGTPVWVNCRYAEADLRLVIGNIEPHQFQGFSGGVKSAAIGLGGAATVNTNHAMMTDPQARLGEYEHNPARQDVEEIGACIGVHFAINAILNHQKKIVHAVAGAPGAVMQAGIPLSRRICQVSVAQRYGLVIASPGGHPKDINVYQAQKGLYHACLVARPQARLLLAAACPEGAGSRSYEAWMQGMASYEQVFERFRQEGFRVGPHKAYQIARDASTVQLRLLSEMAADFARFLLFDPLDDWQAAVDAAVAALPPGERIAILPHASATIPYIKA